MMSNQNVSKLTVVELSQVKGGSSRFVFDPDDIFKKRIPFPWRVGWICK